MIDWIDKLPDSLTGVLIAGGLWFGFNYAVLGERAMARDGNERVQAHCLQRVHAHQSQLEVPRIGLGDLFGRPELNGVQPDLLGALSPRPLTPSQQVERCTCGVSLAMAKRRFDYAVHTASFRLIDPEIGSALAESAVNDVFGGVCGVLPRLTER